MAWLEQLEHIRVRELIPKQTPLMSWQNNIKMEFEERLRGHGFEKKKVYREHG
jgi:hypothetical protein